MKTHSYIVFTKNNTPLYTLQHYWYSWCLNSVSIKKTSSSRNLEKGEHSMSMMKEFKEFAMRGNVVDMAVGIIIGAAFGKIVSSFVNDLIMPPLGVMIGGVDFANLGVTLQEASGDVEAVTLNYGVFIQTVFDFTIVAFAVFLAIKVMNSMKKPAEEEVEAPEEPSKQEVLLEEIRDLLKQRS